MGAISEHTITSIGAHARRALASDPGGRVMAVFDRCLYLESCAGSLLCLGPERLRAGPLNVLYRAVTPRTRCGAGDAPVRVGDRWECTVDGLRIGHRTWPGLDRASIWQPPAIPAEWSRDALRKALFELRAAASERPCGALLDVVFALCRENSRATPLSEPSAFARGAIPPISALMRWIGTYGPPKGPVRDPPDGAARLIGFGPGLTPSGDDFLVGVLVALRSLGSPGQADALNEWLRPRLPGRTSSISRAHLDAAAEGAALAPLHEVLASLLVAKSQAHFDHSLGEIAGVGASSGWDAVAGIVAACHAICER